ncbi:MAG: ParB family transcriptional regulator, chromosome partitioning protein [Clostridia bacterium]|jgi:ParB family chromosome partitioning protein|uniref:Chromosome-partitioning protein ParB n=1 Tax=Thermacetogenium phaeum TaxID=85874 RepID=A0A117LBP9_9THEO|nr:MAG: Chromosome-partitioning protein ParB [Thermacetogenium phaeum]MDK2881376.1 ParB family transcriptional regulator, chromosome partitioning protein [Clostridia bacterium]MDN5376002.1 ParB family transcriptional regulator, chromosome partitioning protein [Thermacetogenium sp.]
MKSKGLGRGLKALIPTTPEGAAEDAEIVELPLERITPSRYQARQDFDEDSIRELASSIKEHGVMQPVVVRPVGEDLYELVVGERRWRACRQAGLETIPAVIRRVDDRTSGEMMLVENIQREDLNPVEEALAYRRLIEEFHLTQEEVASRVGKSRSFIANSLRLLQLPEGVRSLLGQGKLSVGHGKVLLGIPDPAGQERLAREIVEKGLTVREAEKAVQRLLKEGGSRQKAREKEKDVELAAVEDRLRERLGTKVRIRPGRRGGRIEIEYYGRDDLDRLLEFFFGC